MKKIFLILLVTAALLLCSCSSAPALEDIRPRVEQLVNDSHELNDIFFGDGFDTYPRVELPTDRPLEYDAEHDAYYLLFEDEAYGEMCAYYDQAKKEYKYYKVYRGDLPAIEQQYVYSDDEKQIYLCECDYQPPKVEYVYTNDDPSGYDVVRADSEYLSIDEIKQAAEKVFSAEYLELIYSAAFDGVAYVEGASSGVRSARFVEQGGLLRQSNEIDSQLPGLRVYDFSTMKIVRPSNAKRVNISVDTHLEGETDILNVNLTFTLGEDGQWYLDSPTY